jgi:hypothetical protein
MGLRESRELRKPFDAFSAAGKFPVGGSLRSGDIRRPLGSPRCVALPAHGTSDSDRRPKDTEISGGD